MLRKGGRDYVVTICYFVWNMPNEFTMRECVCAIFCNSAAGANVAGANADVDGNDGKIEFNGRRHAVQSPRRKQLPPHASDIIMLNFQRFNKKSAAYTHIIRIVRYSKSGLYAAVTRS